MLKRFLSVLGTRRQALLAMTAAVTAAMTLSGCANYPSHIEAGMQRSDVLTRFGEPSVDVKAPDHEVLIYSTAPFGDLAFAAILDVAGEVQRVE